VPYGPADGLEGMRKNVEMIRHAREVGVPFSDKGAYNPNWESTMWTPDVPEMLIGLGLLAGILWAVYNWTHPTRARPSSRLARADPVPKPMR